MGKMKIAIIGGGAAGFFAAIEARQNNAEADVTIYEKASKMLAKVAITGGGRCNLTNSFEEISDVKQAYPRGFRLIKRLFNRFDYRDAYRWFEDHGVELVTQEDQCVFPESQDAMSVVDCLVSEARRLGVHLVTGKKIVEIVRQEGPEFELVFEKGDRQRFDRVAVTTGGMPRTGDFLSLKSLGHDVEQPIASLFTFNIKVPELLALMGTVVNPVVASIPSTKIRTEGPLLITHWGMSGPAILKLSSHAARYLQECNYQAQVAVNWVAEPNRNIVDQEIRQLASTNPQKQLMTIRPFGLPYRLWQYILQKTELAEDRRWAEVGSKGMNRLVETLTNDIYPINGKGAFRDEFVTCGGVSLSNIDYNTLESKRCPGLYFAGEVLDIDAITGGFNLQAAWTTGYVVGRHIAAPL